MAFGQQSGPPATVRQVRELLDLLKEAGHTDFRDARGPMGFTQRQAGGKFSRDEAEGFISQLQDSEADAPPPVAAQVLRLTAQEKLVRQMPDEQLVAELRRRGWLLMEP